jgi:hypothetical protein
MTLASTTGHAPVPVPVPVPVPEKTLSATGSVCRTLTLSPPQPLIPNHPLENTEMSPLRGTPR